MFLEILWGILNGGHCKLTGTRVLESAEYPDFGHSQNPRVSRQTLNRHGFSPTGFVPAGYPGLDHPGTLLLRGIIVNRTEYC